jgi:hypothetical protein
MKNLVLFIICVIGKGAIAYAQPDSTRTNPSTYSVINPNYQSYPTSDMKKLSSEDIPPSLRNTLRESEYKGWENGTVYFNSMTNEYALQSNPVSASHSKSKEKPKTAWYRFDKNGKRIPDSN